MADPILDDVVLGLDIGTSSIGWALVEHAERTPQAILASGVRIFPAGVNIDPISGKNESRTVDRRQARQRRRMLDRRQMRKTAVARILRSAGMVPPGKPRYEEPEWKQVLAMEPYALRAKALDHALTPMEFGRVMYHLSQRRGFQTNRVAPPKKDEHGVVVEATKRQEADMSALGARTLGEYLARMNPHEQRRRARYTLRRWYKDEFNQIWDAQEGNPALNLNAELKERLEHALFYQRPLRKQNLVGRCELETKRQRASLGLLTTQRFRLLQDLNHIRVVDDGGRERALAPEERTLLLVELEKTEKLKCTHARRLLKLPRGSQFNLEAGGRPCLTGDVTTSRIRSVIGERWDQMTDSEHNQMVEDVMGIQNEEAMIRRARGHWALDETTAETLAQIALEDGHSSLSTKAIRRLLPHLEQGQSYMEALQREYPERTSAPQVQELPPLENLRNPIVQRALAETRRLVNAIVRVHGKPGKIRIELARDLKRNAKAREETWKEMRQREKERLSAAEHIIAETGIRQPKRHEIERALLHFECGGICPYTGEAIPFADLFGDAPRFDIEHIIPFSRSLDDSFANKTLCEASFNRHVKREKTPHEARGSHEDWEGILSRVKGFKSAFRDEKLRRFRLVEVKDADSFAEGFSASQLNDTRYASRKARDYLAQLYPPDERLHRMQVSAGRTTAYLRNAWKLNGLLGSETVKSRDDHRHHAVDAVVIALTSSSWTHALSVAARDARRPGVFEGVPLPWEGFREDLRRAIEPIVVSHRVNRKVNGPLHEDSFYGIVQTGANTSRAVIRKRIEALSDSEIKKGLIVDPAIRALVAQKLQALGLSPGKAFQSETNYPALTTREGRRIPIKRVRVFKDAEPQSIGPEPSRQILPGNNHHMEIFSSKDRKGQPTWRCEVVTLLEAKGRVKAGLPAICRMDSDGNPLVFSLAIGDAVRIEHKGAPVLAVVQKLSKRDYTFKIHTDARMAKDSTGDSIRITSDSGLFASRCEKLAVDPLGAIHVSHD